MVIYYFNRINISVLKFIFIYLRNFYDVFVLILISYQANYRMFTLYKVSICIVYVVCKYYCIHIFTTFMRIDARKVKLLAGLLWNKFTIEFFDWMSFVSPQLTQLPICTCITTHTDYHIPTNGRLLLRLLSSPPNKNKLGTALY